MENAGLYVRLSDEDEDKLSKEELSKSIINQRTLLEDYAAEHDFHVYKVYCDDDYSGLYDDRPGFQAMLEDAKAGRIKVIIAKSQSRFSRNMEHIEKYLHNEFIDWGIRFIGVVDGTDTAVRANKKSRQIYSLTNEWYCEDLSDSVHAVFDSKMKRGEFIGSFAPYGYKKDPQNKNRLIVDEYAADIVRKIYKMYISGNNPSHICDVLKEEGILSPAVYKKQQGLTYRFKQKYNYCEKYGFWASTTIRRILQNRVYLGCMVQGKTRKLNYKSKKMVPMPKQEWVIVEHMHEPIISIEDFEIVQKSFQSRMRSQRTSGTPCVLSGKLKCAQCGNSLVTSGNNRKKTRTYIRCQLSKKSRKELCTSHKIVMEEVEEIILEKIRYLIDLVIDNSDNVKELAQILELNEPQYNKREEIEKEFLDLGKQMEESRKMIKNLYMDKANGIISTEMYLDMSHDFEKNMADADSKRKILEKQLEEIKEEEVRIKDYCKMVHEYCDIKTLTKEIVNKFIDFIELSEDENEENQKLIIHWNI